MTGTTVSHFELREPIGHGGMGHVVQAFDTRLKRPVALKFISPERLADRDARQRFLVEAQAAAALNHPAICTIHEVGEIREGEEVRLGNGALPPGTPFIAMELIEGRTLDAFLAGKRRPGSKECLGIALQIAEGLAAAHSNGIVHRDLKPRNLMVTPEGRVKILDFGLAKPLSRRERKNTTDTATTEFLTRDHVILGTAAYMSPEQILGKPVDGRSDIFSFGVVLYEMLTGRTPFHADSPSEAMARTLETEPESVSRRHPAIPPGLARIVHRCLRKSPEDRYNDTRDLVVALRDLQSGRPRVPWARILGGAAGGAIVFLLARALLPIPGRSSGDPPALPHYRQITSSGTATAPEISPDGRYVAYLDAGTDSTRVMVRDLQGGEALEVSRISRSPMRVRWSPDSQGILFPDPDAGGATLVHHLGGSRRTLYGGWILAWDPSGTQYATMPVGEGDIYLVRVADGDTASVAVNGPFQWVTDLDWSPRGNLFLMSAADAENRYGLWTMPAAGGAPRQLVEEGRRVVCPRWSPNGKAAYYLVQGDQTADLYKVAVDPENGKPAGDPTVVMSGLAVGGMDASFSLAPDAGSLVYSKTVIYSNLHLMDTGGNGPPLPLTTGTAEDSWPRVSPDGTQVAFVRGGDILLQALAGGKPRQLTFLGSCGEAAWSPDGSEMVFACREKSGVSLWRVSVANSRARRFDGVVVAAGSMFRETDTPGYSYLAWEPGDAILYRDQDGDVQVLDPETGTVTPLLREEDHYRGWEFNPRTSPDDGAVALLWNRIDLGVWSVSLKDGETGFLRPGILLPIRWSLDGGSVYCLDLPDRRILQVGLDGRESTFAILPFDRVGGASLGPDAGKLVLSVYTKFTDVWLVRNFDPDAI